MSNTMGNEVLNDYLLKRKYKDIGDELRQALRREGTLCPLCENGEMKNGGPNFPIQACQTCGHSRLPKDFKINGLGYRKA